MASLCSLFALAEGIIDVLARGSIILVFTVVRGEGGSLLYKSVLFQGGKSFRIPLIYL